MSVRVSARVAVLLAIPLALTACGGAPQLMCAQLPGDPVAVADSPHIAHVGANHKPYTSSPPTSGPHVPFTVAPGAYREPIPPELQVHVLEHGHVLIQYAPGGGERARDRVEEFARRYPRDVVVAPNPAMRRGVALTAWGRIDRVEVGDEDGISKFVEALSGRYEHGWQNGARACGAARP
jgi:hypothetical protein